MSSIVHGYIHCFSSDPAAERHNSHALAGLANVGALLVRPMFSLLHNSRSHSYYGHLINFAAYYKEFWCLDESWIDEYQCLLESLVWDKSEVIHVYTGERFLWESDGSQKQDRIQGLRVRSRKAFPSYHEVPGAT
ncbi:hypothetical protein ACM9XB_20500 [Xanthomonas sacchari]